MRKTFVFAGLILTGLLGWALGRFEITAPSESAIQNQTPGTSMGQSFTKPAAPPALPKDLATLSSQLNAPYPSENHSFDREGIRRLNLLKALGNSEGGRTDEDQKKKIANLLIGVIQNHDELWVVKREAILALRKLRVWLSEEQKLQLASHLDSRVLATANYSDETLLRKIILESPQ